MTVCHREMIQSGVVAERWWHRLDDGRIQCDVCPRECKLHEGQRGFCFVRRAQAGGIMLTTYGRASGFCIDPIEKKPLNHFYPGRALCRSGWRAATSAAAFARTGTSQKRARLTG
jgi:pyruvate formate lyase activating enzyme